MGKKHGAQGMEKGLVKTWAKNVKSVGKDLKRAVSEGFQATKRASLIPYGKPPGADDCAPELEWDEMVCPEDSASQVPSYRASPPPKLSQGRIIPPEGGFRGGSKIPISSRILPRREDLGTQDLSRRQSKSGRIVGLHRVYPNQGNPGEARPGMAEVPLEVTRDFRRSDLKEWRTEARDHRSALRRSRTLSLKSLEALQAQEPWAAVEDGPQALDDLIKDPTWLPPPEQDKQVQGPLVRSEKGAPGGGPIRAGIKGRSVNRGEGSRPPSNLSKGRSRPPSQSLDSAPDAPYPSVSSRSRSVVKTVKTRTTLSEASKQGHSLPMDGGECCILGRKPGGRVETRFDFQAAGPGTHTLQPKRSSWVKVRVTFPGGREVNAAEWSRWTSFGTNLHENLINKQLVANGFHPNRDNDGPYVRIHNNSRQFQEIKPGRRLGNMRMETWE